MQSKIGMIWLALVLGILAPRPAEAQNGYSSKVVHGMFGPRVLGQTLRSPVERAERGIARDADGNFAGINRSYSGRRFPEARREPLVSEPRPAPLPWEQPVEPPSRRDEWLRTDETEETEAIESDAEISPWRIDAGSADSASLNQTSSRSQVRSGRNVMASLISGSSPADPLSARMTAILERMTQIRKLSPLRVTVVRETAILRGRVASIRDRELAENVVRLEPGIWRVKNELIVEGI